jgi:hypothetical protein
LKIKVGNCYRKIKDRAIFKVIFMSTNDIDLVEARVLTSGCAAMLYRAHLNTFFTEFEELTELEKALL